MSTVARAIADGRARMRAMEPGMVQRMVDAYGTAWRHVEGQLVIIDGQIAAAAARGETISQSWLNRQTWYRQVQASIDREMARFAQQGVSTIAGTQASAVRIAETVGNAYRVAIDTPFAGRVNAGAMQEWVSAIQPNSPVRGVLDRYGQRVGQSIETNITEGIGSGQGARTITRKIVAEVGPDAVEGRLHTLTRTEGMRAYRGAQRVDMEAMAANIPGTHQWQWIAAKSTRTCPACLSRDGRLYPFNQYPDHQHVACRCTVRLVLDEAIAGPLRPYESGEEWLRRQPVKTQRQVLRSPDRYDAFQEGATLDDFTGVRHDRKWGDSVTVKPMRDVKPKVQVSKAPAPLSPTRSAKESLAYFKENGIKITGAKNATPETLHIWAEGYRDMQAHGYTVNEAITFRKGPSANMAEFAGKDMGGIRVYVDDPMWQNPHAITKQLNEQGFFVATDPKAVVYHEAGHVLHEQSMGTTELFFGRGTGSIRNEIVPEINETVSRYAATNNAEFVAEVFTRRMLDPTFRMSDELEYLYRSLRGPELP